MANKSGGIGIPLKHPQNEYLRNYLYVSERLWNCAVIFNVAPPVLSYPHHLIILAHQEPAGCDQQWFDAISFGSGHYAADTPSVKPLNVN